MSKHTYIGEQELIVLDTVDGPVVVGSGDSIEVHDERDAEFVDRPDWKKAAKNATTTTRRSAAEPAPEPAAAEDTSDSENAAQDGADAPPAG